MTFSAFESVLILRTSLSPPGSDATFRQPKINSSPLKAPLLLQSNLMDTYKV